jgi:hypothetical protein
MKHLVLVLGFAASISACSGTPTAPGPLPAPTRPTSTLSGIVFAAAPGGLAPVAGARVRLEIGSFRVDATSDQNGLYSLSGLYEGSSTVSTTKDGYDTDTRTVVISGDVRLDIRVVPRVGHTLSGFVFEVTPAGRVPVEGVLAVLLQDQYLTTDSNGFFSLDDVYNGDHTASLSKDGFQPLHQTIRVSGNTRIEFQLVRR